MGDARLIIFGRDDEDVLREGLGDAFQDSEARRVNTVVIGDQDSHRRLGLSSS
jgi:hypothetical protein